MTSVTPIIPITRDGQVKKVLMAPGGPELSRIIQGYWRMAEWDMNSQQRLSFIKQHVEMGITTVDHAAVYGKPSCESLFGEVLKWNPGLRDKLEIISKCDIYLKDPAASDRLVAHYNSGKGRIIASVEQSLTRLNTDHLDVLLLHRPDLLMDADEVAEAFAELRKSGKVKHFGVSNFTPSQFLLLQSRLDSPLVTNQVEINPLHTDATEDGTLDQSQQLHVRPMAWSCLAGGKILADQDNELGRTLNELAEELGASSIDQVIYAWVMRLPSNPLPILGSGNIERTRSAVASLELSLNHEQWYRVWVAAKGHGVP